MRPEKRRWNCRFSFVMREPPRMASREIHLPVIHLCRDARVASERNGRSRKKKPSPPVRARSTAPGCARKHGNTVSTKVLLTTQADFAIVHLVAHRPKHLAGTVAEFGEQYADDVRLTLKTQPVLRVRVGQR